MNQSNIQSCPSIMIQKLSMYEIQNTLSLLEKQALPINNETYAQQVKIQLVASFLHPLKNQWEKGQVIDYANGDTLLHWASRSNFWNVTSYLVEQGENPLKINEGGKTAVDLARGMPDEMKERIFHIAKQQLKCQPNSPDITKIVQPQNVDSQALKDPFITLINTHEKMEFDALAKKITSKQIRAYMQITDDHFSHIHVAAQMNNRWYIAWALGKGMASIDAADANGNTFAHILASQGNDQGPYLPQISSLFDKSNNEGKTTLHLLGKNNCFKTLKNTHGLEFLLHNSANNTDAIGNTYYHDAAEAGSTDFLKLIWETLTERKAQEYRLKQQQLGNRNYKVNYLEFSCFNHTNHNKQNILHLAYKANQLETVKYLLTLPGLEPLLEQRDTFGKTPLNYAKQT